MTVLNRSELAPPRASRWRAAALLLTLALMTSGCAGWQAYREGRERLVAGDIVGGMTKLDEAVRAAPDNLEYRRAQTTWRERLASDYAARAQAALSVEAFDEADNAYRLWLLFEPGSERALAGQRRAQMIRRHAAMRTVAQQRVAEGDTTAADAILQEVLRENPADRRAQAMSKSLAIEARQRSLLGDAGPGRLKGQFRKPVTLAFRDAGLHQVFEALKASSGLNFVLDKDVRPDSRVTLSVANKSIEEVVRALLASQKLAIRILDSDTVFVYPNTADKAKEFQEHVIRTFYLGNADAAKTVNTLRSVLRAREVHVDEKLNAIVMRDTVENVRMAERLLSNLDLAEPEVMLELEVLEISTTMLREVGLRLADTLSFSVGGALGAGTLTLPEFRNRDSSMVTLGFNNPLAALILKQSAGDANLLANPRMRIRNRQTAKVLVGERVPVITTTTTANVGTSESVSYLDVGLKLELEPTVSLEDEVSMRVALEVSSITGTVTRSSGLQAFRLGTRNASTFLRVRDGETQVLGGLIQREDRRAATGVPGLSDMPVLGRLFSDTSDTDNRTEIILLITPRVVRNVAIPGPDRLEIPSGVDGPGTVVPSGGSTGLVPTFDARLPMTQAPPALAVPAQAPAPQPSPPSVSMPPIVPAPMNQ
jgi:general secretion pathway protein D